MEIIYNSNNSTYEQFLSRLVAAKFASRLAAKDATLWGSAAAAEAQIRLGWLDFAAHANMLLTAAAQLRSSLNTKHVNDIVLCGMGGSSLAPELISEWCNVPFTVLDATHPDQVAAQITKDLSYTAVVVSSKSGTTAETRAHLAAFEQAFAVQQITAAERIIVITDPGSDLARYAASQGYHVFEADPLVGGRFSALTAFGLVPPTLAGAELGPLVSEAEHALSICLRDSVDNPALQLAAALLSQQHRFVAQVATTSSEYQYLGDWIEQLVAESTGKDAAGVLPMALPLDSLQLRDTAIGARVTQVLVPELPQPESATGAEMIDRQTVSGSSVAVPQVVVQAELGAQFVLWMVATAAMGFLLELNPFDQPDVESAKVAARAALAGDAVSSAALQEVAPQTLLTELAQAAGDADYVMVQAYAPRTAATVAALGSLRDAIAAQLRLPTAANFGPRYLHSTGQFHKGGRGQGLFLQVLVQPQQELEIPDGSGNSFAALVQSQAAGDAAVLTQLQRRVLRVNCADLTALATAVAAA